VTKRRCTLRAEPKGNRKRGRCLRWARPTEHKKSDARRRFRLGEYAKNVRRRKAKRS
jgi:hypothetical protein